MTIDQLRELYQAREDSAPSGNGLSGRVRHQIGIRRRRRRRAAIGATGLVAALAITLPAVAPDRAEDPVGPAAAGPGVARASTTLDPLTVPFTLRAAPSGWQLPGDVDTDRGQARVLLGSTDGSDAIIIRAWDPARAVPPTVARPADPGYTVVSVSAPAPLRITVSGRDADAVRATAAAVEVGQNRPVTLPFQLTSLPQGLHAIGYSRTVSSVGLDGHTGRTVHYDPPLLEARLSLDTRTDVTVPDARLAVEVSTEAVPDPAKYGRPNRVLLGHPARYEIASGTSVLQVFGLRGCHVTLVSQGGPSGPRLNEQALTEILRGLRLVDRPTVLSSWTPSPFG